jgi:multicomponent Na+:H+ antiporter subunit B
LKTAALVLVLALGLALAATTRDFPDWGDAASPANTRVSARYVTDAYHETHTPNLVTAVLGDYRSYDTMFETIVVLAAALGCFFILRASRRMDEECTLYYRHIPTGAVLHMLACDTIREQEGLFEQVDSDWTPHDVIILTTARLLVPFIQLFGLYVLAHGHYSPGGGFQGGVIFASGYILLAVSHDLRTLVRELGERALGLMAAAGAVLYVGVGAVGFAAGRNFLDYASLTPWLAETAPLARSLGILLVEVGVALTVTAAMTLMYKLLSSQGTITEGL